MNSVSRVLVVSMGRGGFSGGQNQIQTTCLHELGMCWLPVAPLGVAVVKNLPAMQKMWVGSLRQEDPLEKGVATHSSILAWKRQRSLVVCGPWGGKELDTTELEHTHTQLNMTLRVTSTNKDFFFFSPWK